MYYFCWAEGIEDFELGVDDEGEVGWELGGHVCGGVWIDGWGFCVEQDELPDARCGVWLYVLLFRDSLSKS